MRDWLLLISWCTACSSTSLLPLPSPFPTINQFQFLGAQSAGGLPQVTAVASTAPTGPAAAVPTAPAAENAFQEQSRSSIPASYPAYSEYRCGTENGKRSEEAGKGLGYPGRTEASGDGGQPTAPARAAAPQYSDQRAVERIFDLASPSAGGQLDVDNLNSVMNRVGRELHFLSEKSRECLDDKVRGLAQLKRMREGLKHAYKDIYNLQFALAAYQDQLKEMQDYLRTNRGRIVVVDNKQLGEMYSMVRRLQSAAESMVSGTFSEGPPKPRAST